jgi:phosphate transport system substrate-binding protein
MQASNGAVVQAVSKNRYAIGYIGLGYLNRGVKALKVNEIEASVQTSLSGTYPIARPLFMLTDGWPKGRGGQPASVAPLELICFILLCLLKMVQK